ncbi:lonely Cys domain-containing protein, partial [Streptomyces sp. 2MCAF27]
VRLPDGRVLDAEGLADALAADPELAGLPENVEVVLVLAEAGDQHLEMLRAVATRLNRKVWGPSGQGRLVADAAAGGHRPVIVDRDANLPYGGWVPFDPPARTVPFEDREWTALDGTTFRDSDVYSRPLVDENHDRFGRISVPVTDSLRQRERLLRAFPGMRRLVHKTPAGDGYRVVDSEEVTPDPAVYVFAAHGQPGRLKLALRDGRTVWLGKRDAARYVSGLREVRELPTGHRLHLEVCWGASDGDPRQHTSATQPAPHVDDPLDDVPFGQYAANESRREATAVTRPTGLDAHDRVVIDAPGGEAGRRVTYRPEPLDHELDRLARDEGVDTIPGVGPSEARATTLRLVRALRQVFGHEIEDDRGVPGGRYERAMRGIVALERMRANDPAINQFTPFRLDMLDFFTHEHSGRAPDEAGYLALLDFARDRVTADLGARLSAAVPAPVLHLTLGELAAKGEQLIRHTQSLSPTATFTPRHVASTLWATARAAKVLFSDTPKENREPLGRRVLHLSGADPWDRPKQETLWALSAKAIAEGVDVTNHDALAAYHLAESGAFAPGRMLKQGQHVQGVNYSGTPAPAGVNWGVVHQTVMGPGGTATQPVQPVWVGPGRPMPLLYLIHVDQAGNVGLQLPGRPGILVPEAEFLELMAFDPALR